MSLVGADPATVRDALETGDPLPGTTGFAGRIDGRFVRDVLGRVPLFVDGTDWAHAPHSLDDPRPVPAGVVGPHIEALERRWRLPAPAPRPAPAALDALEGAIGAATASVTADSPAIAFSGGLDSALLAAHVDGPLYAVGFPDSHDLAVARSAADRLDRALTEVVVDHATLEEAVPAVARAIDRTNAMDVSIALGLFLVARRAAADGHDALVVGQGADELFGGYEKVALRDHRVEAETVRGAVAEVTGTLPDQLERDWLTIDAAGLDPVAPYLDDRVVAASLRLPESLLVEDGVRKRGLRAVGARSLPEAVATRDKKAIQYGTAIARELDRLARQAGYKRRLDDHVDRYVASLSP